MQNKTKSWLGVIAVAALSLAGLTPAHAAATPVTYGNGNCDFSAVGQGHGSQSDPFIINSGLDIQEMNDCQVRNKNVSAFTVNNDGTATLTVNADNGAYGVGQVIEVYNTGVDGLDNKDLRVLASTDTTVTVKSTATAGTTGTSGAIAASMTYFKLGGDIDLGGATTDGWNDNRSLAITAATKNSDGSIVYTAANSLQGGEKLFISGMGDSKFNIGFAQVLSATANDFTVNSPYVMADGAATTAGGTARFGGWQPFNLSNVILDGAGHTIKNLSVYRDTSYSALFSNLNHSQVSNLTIKDSTVNTTVQYGDPGNDRNNYNGLLAASMDRDLIKNVSVVNGNVVAGGGYSGLIAGYISRSLLNGINVAGAVSVNVTGTYPGNSLTGCQWTGCSAYGRIGGVAGDTRNITFTNVTSSATVDGKVVSDDMSADAGTVDPVVNYISYVGGLIGQTENEFEGRNLTASGDVRGSAYVGGAFGYQNWDGSISNASASGNVTGSTGPTQNLGAVAYVGGFAGQSIGDMGITNITATGNVTVDIPAASSAQVFYVGGYTGYSKCCGLTNKVKSTGNVTVNNLGSNDTYAIGGLMGSNDCCQAVAHSESTGNVVINSAKTSVRQVGGFVGYWNCCGVDTDNKSSGNVTVTIADISSGATTSQVGGYAGYLSCCGTMANITSSGNVTTTNGNAIGGFVGHSDGLMTFNDITVTGNVTDTFSSTGQSSDWAYANVGGFIGMATDRNTIERVGVTSNISVTKIDGGNVVERVGGILGGRDSNRTGVDTISYSYFKGAITGGTRIGGLVGYVDGASQFDADHNYVAATLTATEPNGIVDAATNGWFQDNTASNFYDVTLAGSAQNSALFNATTTANMKTDAAYKAKGWTFTDNSPWRLDATKNDGYPYLVVPSNDNTSLGSGTNTTTTVTVNVPTPIVYTTIKSVKFTKKVVALSKAQKKLLDGVAKTIKNSTGSIFTVSVSVKAKDLALSSKRALAVHTYLLGALKKLKSTKVVSVSITPATSGNVAVVNVQSGQ